MIELLNILIKSSIDSISFSRKFKNMILSYVIDCYYTSIKTHDSLQNSSYRTLHSSFKNKIKYV